MKRSPAIGYLLQCVGIVLLPVGLLGGMSGGSLHLELSLLGIGGVAFLLGRRMSGG
ncbi:MAG: hypothetical protein HY608_04350 [Planctomycetes bacterium]|nr:hypothetical protein [Planctomycetota bacterium]